jgi:hypothetical protein
MQISRLLGFDYLVLCSMEDTNWTANARIGSSELCCRWDKECAFLRSRPQLFGPEHQRGWEVGLEVRWDRGGVRRFSGALPVKWPMK